MWILTPTWTCSQFDFPLVSHWTICHRKYRPTAIWRLNKFADGTLTMDTFLCLYFLGWRKRYRQNFYVLPHS